LNCSLDWLHPGDRDPTTRETVEEVGTDQLPKLMEKRLILRGEEEQAGWEAQEARSSSAAQGIPAREDEVRGRMGESGGSMIREEMAFEPS
jgi:hypothetical protein